MRAVKTAGVLVSGLSLAAFGLAACGSDDDAATATGTGAETTITVVASTNVWADIARQVGGDVVSVEALISDPAVDPHHYESTPRDVATVQDADLVVFNGGGYDQFVQDIIDSTDPGPRSVSAYEILVHHDDVHTDDEHHDGEHHDGDEHGHGEDEHGHDSEHEGGGEAGHHDDESDHDHAAGANDHDHDHGHGSANEHVWYDFHIVSDVARAIANELSELDPDNSDTFSANAEETSERIEELEDRADEIRATTEGIEVAQTEPLAEYLLDALGVADIAPTEFTRAVEHGNDPSAAVTAQFSDLLADGEAQALVYNSQTESPTTQRMREIAEDNDVPIIEVSESLPAGMDYFEWMHSTLDDFERALTGA
ncbi:metal ABC transporter solute-binding protein, Zn/Mn family [Hoyosella subflava]|uniref:ABC-type transporter n=1 Tax=Hoyosella subflava (strain DSM 45089 / JCM 17490 / NBRC 109087 / DQS3-9A1) TaxID=443218 RepID=F6EKD7_HOYSD|nr:zinc ABC transporter substrate-binding protein [Hoyosella subflava]AEF39108.1 ABC-type transporter [Hoyosella subflava DQS3-9A1]